MFQSFLAWGFGSKYAGGRAGNTSGLFLGIWVRIQLATDDRARKRARSARTNLGRSAAGRPISNLNFGGIAEHGRFVPDQIPMKRRLTRPTGIFLAPEHGTRLKPSHHALSSGLNLLKKQYRVITLQVPSTPTKNFKSPQLIGARFLTNPLEMVQGC